MAAQPQQDNMTITTRYVEFENRVYAAVADEQGLVQNWADLETEMAALLEQAFHLGIPVTGLGLICHLGETMSPEDCRRFTFSRLQAVLADYRGGRTAGGTANTGGDSEQGGIQDLASGSENRGGSPNTANATLPPTTAPTSASSPKENENQPSGDRSSTVDEITSSPTRRQRGASSASEPSGGFGGSNSAGGQPSNAGPDDDDPIARPNATVFGGIATAAETDAEIPGRNDDEDPEGTGANDGDDEDGRSSSGTVIAPEDQVMYHVPESTTGEEAEEMDAMQGVLGADSRSMPPPSGIASTPPSGVQTATNGPEIPSPHPRVGDAGEFQTGSSAGADPHAPDARMSDPQEEDQRLGEGPSRDEEPAASTGQAVVGDIRTAEPESSAHFRRFGQVRHSRSRTASPLTEFEDDDDEADPSWNEEDGEFEDLADKDIRRRRVRRSSRSPAPQLPRKKIIVDDDLDQDTAAGAMEGELYEVNPPCDKCVQSGSECYRYFRIGKYMRRKSCANCHTKKVSCSINQRNNRGPKAKPKPRMEKGKGRAKAESDDEDRGDKGKGKAKAEATDGDGEAMSAQLRDGVVTGKTDRKGKRKATDDDGGNDEKAPAVKKRKVKVEQPGIGVAGPSNYQTPRAPRPRNLVEDSQLYAALNEKIEDLKIDIADTRERMASYESAQSRFETGTNTLIEKLEERLQMVEGHNERALVTLKGVDDRTDLITKACEAMLKTMEEMNNERRAERGLLQLRPQPSQTYLPGNMLFGITPTKASQQSALGSDAHGLDFGHYGDDVFMTDADGTGGGDQYPEDSPVVRSIPIKAEISEEIDQQLLATSQAPGGLEDFDMEDVKPNVEGSPSAMEVKPNVEQSPSAPTRPLTPIIEVPTPTSSFNTAPDAEPDERSQVNNSGETALAPIVPTSVSSGAQGEDSAADIIRDGDGGLGQASAMVDLGDDLTIGVAPDGQIPASNTTVPPSAVIPEAATGGLPEDHPSSAPASATPEDQPSLQNNRQPLSHHGSDLVLPPSSEADQPPEEQTESTSPEVNTVQTRPPSRASSVPRTRRATSRPPAPITAAGSRPVTRSSSRQREEPRIMTRSRSKSVSRG